MRNFSTAVLVSPQGRLDRSAVERRAVRLFDAAKVDQGGEQVLALGQPGDVPAASDAARRPADKARYAVPPLKKRRLASLHSGVVERHANRATIVAQEKNQGVFFETRFS